MAETLTEQTAILAAAIEDEDLLWLVHMSAAANTRDRKVSIENLREAFSISQGSIPAIQTAHGLSVGDVITINLSGAYVEATADLESNAGVVGVVVKVIDANAFRFKTSGYVSGLSGLTVGEIYYLQDAGGLGTTEGTIVRPVLVAVTTTEGIILTVSSGNAVDSVFSRTGEVVAAASDYDASQVDNDSGVSGAFVSDALYQLDTDLGTYAALSGAVFTGEVELQAAIRTTPDTSLGTTGTLTLDVAAASLYDAGPLTGDITFASSNLVAGRSVTARIVNGATLRTLAFPAGWVFVGAKPADIAASKTGILTATAFGTTDADVVAAWAVEE